MGGGEILLVRVHQASPRRGHVIPGHQVIGQRSVDSGDTAQKPDAQGESIAKPLFRQFPETDDVIVGHDNNAAVDIVREEIRYEKCLSLCQPAFGEDIRCEPGCRFFAMFGAEGAEALHGGVVIPGKVELLRLDGPEMGEVACPPRQRIDAYLEADRGGRKALPRIQKSALRFNLPELDHPPLSPCHRIFKIRTES
jgi:hypothetical protein